MLAVQGGLGIGNVGRRKQICFQKVGGSSTVVRKLVERGRGKGLAYLKQVGIFFWTSCIEMHADCLLSTVITFYRI
jgi:hypothetical protein